MAEVILREATSADWRSPDRASDRCTFRLAAIRWADRGLPTGSSSRAARRRAAVRRNPVPESQWGDGPRTCDRFAIAMWFDPGRRQFGGGRDGCRHWLGWAQVSHDGRARLRCQRVRFSGARKSADCPRDHGCAHGHGRHASHPELGAAAGVGDTGRHPRTRRRRAARNSTQRLPTRPATRRYSRRSTCSA